MRYWNPELIAESNMGENLIYSKNPPVSRIVLNRPQKLNALDGAMWKCLLESLLDFESDSESRVLIITGNGRAFSSGVDLSDFAGSARYADKVFRKLIQIPKPIIAGVNGLAYGAGFELVIASDLAIASSSARFRFPEPELGLIPPFGLWILKPLLMDKRVRWLMLSSREIDSQEAFQLGLVNQVVPDQQLSSKLDELALEISRFPSSIISKIKSLLNREISQPDLNKILGELVRLIGAPEFREARAKFLGRKT